MGLTSGDGFRRLSNAIPRRAKNISGQVFGSLTVVGFSHAHSWGPASTAAVWDVICECGRTKKFIGSELRSGRRRHCGECEPDFRKKYKDLTGNVYGKNTVLGYSHTYKDAGGRYVAMWDVRCECGNIKKSRYDVLVRGRSKSCGCSTKEYIRKKLTGDGAALAKRRIYMQYKYGAKQRGYSFNVSQDQLIEITQQNCHFCGAPPTKEYIGRRATGYLYNGIDRLDNEIGYESGNLVAACWFCNKLKLDHQLVDFLQHIKDIADYASSSGLFAKYHIE